MLTKFLNDKSWNNRKQANAHNPEFCSIIDNFFKPDMISAVKFFDNYNFLTDKINFQFEDKAKRNSPSINYFEYEVERPLGYKTWFIAAYPDVVYWYRKNMEKVREYSQFADFFDDEDSDDWENRFMENGIFKFDILKRFVHFYKNAVNAKLECSV
jgi:hypothetical protein